jgi:hypothetical protein
VANGRGKQASIATRLTALQCSALIAVNSRERCEPLKKVRNYSKRYNNKQPALVNECFSEVLDEDPFVFPSRSHCLSHSILRPPFEVSFEPRTPAQSDEQRSQNTRRYKNSSGEAANDQLCVKFRSESQNVSILLCGFADKQRQL